MKRIAVFIQLMLLLVSSFSWASAQSTITISKNEIVSGFPGKLTFQVSASSSGEIQQIKLLYRTNGSTCQSATAQQEVDLTPASSVDAEWAWDFTQSGVLPPGAEVSWQWQVSDASGDILLTDEQSYLVNDTRHDWNTLKSAQVTLQWYEGNNSFGKSLLGIANESLDRMAANAGIQPTGQVWLTIYPTTQELLEVDIHASEWAGGIAYPEYNSSIMAIAPGDLSWAGSVIPHELAHLVSDAMIFNCKGIYPPTWLGEGLAVYAEGETSPANLKSVTTALEHDKLPPLRTLGNGFSSDAGDAGLSYAQSGMVVTYMVGHYGAQKMTELLASMQSGNGFDKALRLVYGKDTDGIDAEWRISLGYQPQPTLVPTSSSKTAVPTLALWTSAVRPSASPTPPPTTTSTPVTPTETPVPTVNSTQVDPTQGPTTSQASPVTSSMLTTVYIIGIACVTAVFAIIGIIVLIILSRRKRPNP